MTEAEWLACSEPLALVHRLYQKVSDRKLRLFTCACARLVADRGWGAELDQRIRKLIGVGERFADGGEAPRGRATALGLARRLLRGRLCIEAVGFTLEKDAWEAACGIIDVMSDDSSWLGPGREEQRGDATQSLARVVRECFGSLHLRPVSFNPAWRTTDVMLLAQGIYDAKAFDRMPILADALQDAGCDNPDILAHCRDTALTHVRGCWALDLVLGKE